MVTKGAVRNSNKNLKPKRVVTYKYFVNCEGPVRDGIFDLDDFEKFILSHYKVNDRINSLGKKVRVFKKNDKLYIHTEIRVKRSYIKYLLKKYLKKESLRDFLKIVAAPGKKQRGYDLKYYPLNEEGEGDEDMEDDE
mmetsp:Transcript_4873/g.7214  ORF Transcript_4873/g.7214 Transcript_4873/m.7214 type:complete len:137 (-) Transcript_4873:143-553(-)|eukprot:CAMPEP_0117428648 /NCGR_PEP_ID=MMETSP0758-20121206/8307_1 /TAXON_ID=63605 /ORGANISM="Percolomonas cosmopolitus, Strain AE-1 (ATCC 50343)" /LENGTH=136 /DNA_ID=CAMNT_0005215117 /DNA_START=12 /DNA_END=422 /DNA_ORIENTATION=+